MDLEKLKTLQEILLGIISLMTIEGSEEGISNIQDQAFKIINELRDHINDDIEINDNLRMTTLDWIAFCDSHDGARLNNRSLLDLEDAVKSIGGKTSQELGRVREISQQEADAALEYIGRIAQARMLFREVMESRAEFIASMQERQNRNLREESRKAIYQVTLAISIVICSRTRLGESEVGNIVGATLGGLLSIPSLVLSAQLTHSGFRDITTSREITRRVVHSISEPMAGLSAALAGGTIMLISSIVGSIAGTNMEFGESLRSGLIATTAAAIVAGTGAALSTALARRMFTPVSTNLENVATEQPNVQGGQNR